MEELENKLVAVLDELKLQRQQYDPEEPCQEDMHYKLVELQERVDDIYNDVTALDKYDPYKVAISTFKSYIRRSQRDSNSFFYDKQKESHNREIWRMCIERVKERQQKAMKK